MHDSPPLPRQVPWEDLRYLFGEIMYGGHIADDWDRKLCRVYLEEFMNPSLVRHFLSHFTEEKVLVRFFLNFLFYIGVELINNGVFVSGVQHRDSVIHTHVIYSF